MTLAIEATGLGMRFGARWALQHADLQVPSGKVVGLVGANGAGKSTLLHLAVGLLQPSEGRIEVLGERPASSPAQLAKVGFVAQDVPVYRSLTVAEHLTLGARLNPSWNASAAEARLAKIDLDLGQRAGALSGGQRAQLALTLAIGKSPDLLLLDEPVASLDPLARRQFLQDLMELAADGLSIVVSSHLIEDLERTCDHLIVLAGGRARLAGDLEDLVEDHRIVTCPRLPPCRPGAFEVVTRTDTERQTTLLIRGTAPVLAPTWTVASASLEEIVLAYLAIPGPGSGSLVAAGGAT